MRRARSIGTDRPAPWSASARRAAALGVLLALAVAPGCYRHVVSARGPATERTEVHEPNLKNERIPVVDDVEDAVFGARPE